MKVKNAYLRMLKKNHTRENTTIGEYLINRKATKKKDESRRFFEKRNLQQFTNFFKFFGFRKNRNRPARRFRKTKKYKKFSLYKKIRNFFSHMRSCKGEPFATYPLQGIRTFLSYYKMR